MGDRLRAVGDQAAHPIILQMLRIDNIDPFVDNSVQFKEPKNAEGVYHNREDQVDRLLRKTI